MRSNEKEARIYMRAAMGRFRRSMRGMLPDEASGRPSREGLEAVLALRPGKRTSRNRTYREAVGLARYALALMDGATFRFVTVPDEADRNGFSPRKAVLGQLLLFDAGHRRLVAHRYAYRIQMTGRPDGKDVKTGSIGLGSGIDVTTDMRTLHDAGAVRVRRTRTLLHVLWVPESDGDADA